MRTLLHLTWTSLVLRVLRIVGDIAAKAQERDRTHSAILLV